MSETNIEPLVAPIAWGIQEWMRQRRRLIDNDDPEAVQGKKFGYVREGDKWFPAFVTSRERDEGWIGSNKTQMRLEYGNELRWKQQKGTGNWVPYFEDGSYRLKDFHVWDSYLDTDNEAGYDYMMKTDPLRDFYLLSDEDTDKLLRGFAGGDVIQAGKHSYTAEEQAAFHEAQSAAYDSFKPYDDEGWESYWKSQPQWEKSQMLTADRRRSEHNPAEYIGWSGYIEHLNDLRKSLDFMQDYRYSDAGQLQTSNHGENEFAGSRKLSRILMSQSGGEMGDANELERSAMYFQSNSQQVGLDRFQDRPELQYLAEMYTQAIDDLYGAQKRAGKSMKFDTLYQPSATADRRLGPAFKDRGYMFYQDNAWEFGAIDTADQLKEALRKIEESSDAEYAGTEHFRNADQRSYLAQKAYARYLHSKINQLGGSDYMHPRAVSWQGEKGKPEILDPFAKARLDETTDKSHYYLPYPYRGNWNLEKSYGNDPLFSEIDDRDDEYQSYGSELVHRDGYDPLDTTEAGKKYTTSLVESSGVFDGAPDPDMVAGRYPDQQAFDDWMDRDEAPSMFYDESKKDFVYSGEQGDNTYWDEDSQSYRIDTSVEPEPDDGWYQAVEYSKAHGGDPQDYMGPDGTFAGPAAAGPPPFGYRKDGKVRKHPKRDVKPLQPVVGDWSAAAAVGDWSAAAPDSLLPVPGEDYPLGAGWRYDEESDMVIAPNNTTWFLDETEQMFHFAEQLEESHVKQAADAKAYAEHHEPEPEPEEQKQVVPDEVPGASAPHQVMYHEQHHQAMHYAPDATAPVHIKVI